MIDSNLKSHRIKAVRSFFEGSLKSCSVCPRACRIDRVKGIRGYCRAPANPVVYNSSPHHGEEPPLSGRRGSGTIFFSYCNMKCVYCQNYYFSQLDEGEEITIEALAKIMLRLQCEGCHNINLVSPTHFVAQIVMALDMALTEGLNIPIVYNTGGYDLPSTIKLLDGIIDIYMPDMRYSDNLNAKKYSDAENYVTYNRDSVMEMHRQVGDLILDKEGIARKGLIIRLLALPQDISGMIESLKFIRREIGDNTYLSIMSQYYPTFKAYNHKDISRGVTRGEYANIVDEARLLGLNNGWIQEAPADFDPKFFGTNIHPRKEPQ